MPTVTADVDLGSLLRRLGCVVDHQIAVCVAPAELEALLGLAVAVRALRRDKLEDWGSTPELDAALARFKP